MDNKLPRFLQGPNYFNSTGRHKLKIDDIEGDGTALDIVKRRPSYKYKIGKRVEKNLLQMEEWIDFINNKHK